MSVVNISSTATTLSSSRNLYSFIVSFYNTPVEYEGRILEEVEEYLEVGFVI
jgi:hypothetical protein